jgi:hypothetical protein
MGQCHDDKKAPAKVIGVWTVLLFVRIDMHCSVPFEFFSIAVWIDGWQTRISYLFAIRILRDTDTLLMNYLMSSCPFPVFK